MEEMEKSKDYNLMVAGRLNKALKTMGIEQSEMAKKCQNRGYPMSASKLNKMLNNGMGMQLSSVALICEILGLSMNEVCSLNPEEKVFVPQKPAFDRKPFYKETPRLIRHSHDREFENYLGDYHVLFNKTKSDSTGYHIGKMRLIKTDGDCLAIITFPFIDGDGNERVKEYRGTVTISTRMSALYVIVENEELGEIVCINFSYMQLNFDKLKCRIGAVITTCTGDSHLPTMQRIIISRDPFPKELIEFLDGELRINRSEILIPVDDYKRFLQEINVPLKEQDFDSIEEYECMRRWMKYKSEFRDMFLSTDNKDGIPGLQPREYYAIPESQIRDSRMSPLAKAQTIAKLRSYSVSPRHNKIGKKGDERVYRMIREWYEEKKKIQDEKTQQKNM